MKLLPGTHPQHFFTMCQGPVYPAGPCGLLLIIGGGEKKTKKLGQNPTGF